MEKLIHEVTLGFSNESGILNIPISQYDINRIISIGFTDYGEDYEIPENTIVFLKAKKPDGTEINTDEFCSVVDNKVHLKIFEQLSAVNGTVQCEIILSDETGTQYTSNHFNLIVTKSVHNDEHLRSSDTYKNIIEILLEIQTIKENLIFKTDKDRPNGIPSLDENAKIPREELYNADLNNKGVVKLVDSVESNSTSDAATANSVKTVNDNLNEHINNELNPHNVTKQQLELGNVDNTSDIDKPVSTAQQNALNTALSTHNISDSSHSDMRLLISGITTRLNALADSDDSTLDQLSEIVAYIKNNKSLIDGITTSKVNISDIIDDLMTNSGDKVLSAKQGTILKGLITDLTEVVGNKVDKVSGKGLSTNDYTTAEKTKLAGLYDLPVKTASSEELNNVLLPTGFYTVSGGDIGISNNGEHFNVINFGVYHNGGRTQIAIPFQYGLGSTLKMFIRRSENTGWTGWTEVNAGGNSGGVDLSEATGVLPVSKGGTGQTTSENALNALINSLSTGVAMPVDNDYTIIQSANGGDKTKTYHRKPMTSLWNYIRNKMMNNTITALGIRMENSIIFNNTYEILEGSGNLELRMSGGNTLRFRDMADSFFSDVQLTNKTTGGITRGFLNIPYGMISNAIEAERCSSIKPKYTIVADPGTFHKNNSINIPVESGKLYIITTYIGKDAGNSKTSPVERGYATVNIYLANACAMFLSGQGTKNMVYLERLTNNYTGSSTLSGVNLKALNGDVNDLDSKANLVFLSTTSATTMYYMACIYELSPEHVLASDVIKP